MADDDEDFPLADHPGPGGPKAGDPEMNRARDLGHLDVRAGRQPVAEARQPEPEPPEVHALDERTLQPLQPGNPVGAAWQAFKQTSGYTSAINSADPGWSMFMAGYAARDSQP